MKITILAQGTVVDGKEQDEGSVVELPDREAGRMISRGLACAVRETEVKTRRKATYYKSEETT